MEDGGWRMEVEDLGQGAKVRKRKAGKRESGDETSVRHEIPTNRLESR
jgi:hypothetical protein